LWPYIFFALLRSIAEKAPVFLRGSIPLRRQALAGTSATPRTQRPATWCKDLSKPVHHEATRPSKTRIQLLKWEGPKKHPTGRTGVYRTNETTHRQSWRLGVLSSLPVFACACRRSPWPLSIKPVLFLSWSSYPGLYHPPVRKAFTPWSSPLGGRLRTISAATNFSIRR
jgi:hypothetical protein